MTERTYTREDADALLGSMPATSGGQTAACPDGFVSHALRSGETLRSVAHAYGLTLNELLLYNPNVNPFYYRTGDILCVPAPADGEDAPEDASSDETPAEPPVSDGEIGEDGAETPAEPEAPDQTHSEEEKPAPDEIVGDTEPPACASGRYYRIAAGDTLERIARRLGVRLSALVDLNPGVDPGNLTIGALLCLPARVPASCGGSCGSTGGTGSNDGANTGASGCVKKVRVPAGAGFVDFLTRYDLSFAALSAANKGVDLLALRPGQTLCVPEKGGPCAPGTTLQEGDSLQSLALAHSVSVASLLLLNPCLSPSDFAAGKTVYLPNT